MPTTERETWLSLGKAAKRLNVHPSTLRRWADHGDVPMLLTPGGHRRFTTSDLDRFAQEHRVEQEAPIAEMWAGEALTQARQELVVHRDDQWLAVYDDHARQRHRELGMQLMGLTMRFLGSDQESADCLEEARQIGREYGTIALAMGQSLSGALTASIFFRDMLVESAVLLPESAHVRPAASRHLMRRINALLNAVHLAIAEVYEVDHATGVSRA
jgi:excisionase family DNA binding protein